MRRSGLLVVFTFLYILLSLASPAIQAPSLTIATWTVLPLSVALLVAPVHSLVASPPAPHIPGHCIHPYFNPWVCKVDPNIPVIDHVSQELLDRMKLMSQYAAAAYCAGNANSSRTRITCPVGNCPLVEKADARSIVEFDDMAEADDTGFISIDDQGKNIVLAFRGSKSRANWHQDLKAWRVATGWCHECNAHKGFWECWLQARELVLKTMKMLMRSHPDYRYVVVGHSLGAAVATLAAGEIRQIDDNFRRKTELFTFGSPRVGNTHLVRFLSDQSDCSYRITSMNDPIPRLPPVAFGYMHTTPEYWIHRHPLAPGTHDISIVRGYYSEKGNTGQPFDIDMNVHRHYFGFTTHCLHGFDDPSPWRRDPSLASSSAVRRYPLGSAWELLQRHVDMSMVDLAAMENPRGERDVATVFPPGSVSDFAAEAIYGPAAIDGTSQADLTWMD